MKKTMLVYFFTMVFLVSCSTTNQESSNNIDVEAIQTNAVATALASDGQTTEIVPPTETSPPTETPLPTETSIPTETSPPTETPLPKEKFVFSGGSCLGWDYLPSGEPLDYENCDVDERKQIELAPGEGVTYSSFKPESYPSFCTIQRLDGTIVTSSVDSLGAGEATCIFLEEGMAIETTPPPDNLYVVSFGSCLGFNYIPSGDPTTYSNCDVDEKYQMQISPGDSVSYSSFKPETYPSFCALHKLDGTYVTSDVDSLGALEAVCTAP